LKNGNKHKDEGMLRAKSMTLFRESTELSSRVCHNQCDAKIGTVMNFEPNNAFRLTSFSHGGGCGFQMTPDVLSEILRSTKAMHGPEHTCMKGLS